MLVTPVLVPPTSLSPPCGHLLPSKNFNAAPHSNIELQFILTYAEIVNYAFYSFSSPLQLYFISPSFKIDIDILSTGIKIICIYYIIFHFPFWCSNVYFTISYFLFFSSLFFHYFLFFFFFLFSFVISFFLSYTHTHTHTRTHILSSYTHTHTHKHFRIHRFFILNILHNKNFTSFSWKILFSFVLDFLYSEHSLYFAIIIIVFCSFFRYYSWFRNLFVIHTYISINFFHIIFVFFFLLVSSFHWNLQIMNNCFSIIKCDDLSIRNLSFKMWIQNV